VGRWPSPLYVICDVDLCERAGWQPLPFVRACLSAGATVLQIRAKHLPSGRLLDLIGTVVDAAKPFDALVLVNDRPDLARIAMAGGVHLGQEDVSPGAARVLLGPGVRIGLSTHTDAQIRAAVDDAAIDHLAIGPVFGTATKETGYEAVGLERVRRAAQLASDRGLPVVAIGGITLERAPDVIAAGASAVAIISDLVCADPASRVRAYLERLHGSCGV
jgi:thiamine-phosphate pyrophosphorylase